jgi:hypothetical protein
MKGLGMVLAEEKRRCSKAELAVYILSYFICAEGSAQRKRGENAHRERRAQRNERARNKIALVLYLKSKGVIEFRKEEGDGGRSGK